MSSEVCIRLKRVIRVQLALQDKLSFLCATAHSAAQSMSSAEDTISA